MTQLQRLVLDFRSGELLVRCLYRTKGSAGPNTKARRREVEQLVHEGLRHVPSIFYHGDTKGGPWHGLDRSQA